MSDPYANLPAPPSAEGGDLPDRIKFQNPGQSVEGHLVNVKWKEPKNGMEGCPIIEIQQPTGVVVAVFCNPWSLWRALDEKKPPLGSYVRVTFTGYDGQSKLFQLDVAPPQNGQAVQPQMQQPAAQPQGFGDPNAGAAPWGAQPQQAQPAQAGTPWGAPQG